ncbi:DUF3425 domain-containing protein [Aspergillus clavatus NRRL 1]|uniref:Uncharacterized protein n=1 Tax=Aspergillus clavatus (strain ATCC 1007 / CBS 513.65 / DSM 816 / NCTC 3887 / NRRL 1 / QM 1276 / 107) TaxID=344612 RepID=A1CDW4_ASPCL|nr:uncharacterized protein ACLA_008010 [Aspergillus clavatus NRRL 1]EAW12041.1 conserved hypothetical protein [Aspergillus clavatus NRRL 1]
MFNPSGIIFEYIDPVNKPYQRCKEDSPSWKKRSLPGGIKQIDHVHRIGRQASGNNGEACLTPGSPIKRRPPKRLKSISNSLSDPPWSARPPPTALFPGSSIMQLIPSQSMSAHRNPSSSDDTPPEDNCSNNSTPASSSASGDYNAVAPRPRGRCLHSAQVRMLLDRFSKSAYQSYVLGSPAADHLITLSKVNVFRAFASIMSVLGMSHTDSWMYEDALSPFPTMPAGYVEELKLPPSLRPTQLQRTVPHHPWLDFFPHPQIRDNLLTTGEDNFDDDQLCCDIMGFWDSGMDGCSLLVWGEPSDPKNWEVTEKFLKKWPWVVRGCPDLLQSTNHWRQQRGEKLIFRYL